jgi:membrane protein
MLSWSRLSTLASRTAGEFKRDHCSHLAAGIAYYALFAIFPLLVFIAGMTGLFVRDADAEREVVDAILDSLPVEEDDSRADVQEAVHELAGGSSGLVGLAGLVVTAWSASALFGAVRRSINIAYDVEAYRPAIQQKLVDLGLVAGVGLFFALSIALTGLVAFARDAAGDVPGLEWAADRRIAWALLGVGISTSLSFVAFFVLYWWVPAMSVRPGDACVGAGVAAVLFEVAKAGFSLYLRNFGNYDVVFGTIGAAAGLLIWVYVSANILLLGAELASEYPRVRRGEYDTPAGPKVPWRERVRRGLLGLVRKEP